MQWRINIIVFSRPSMVRALQYVCMSEWNYMLCVSVIILFALVHLVFWPESKVVCVCVYYNRQCVIVMCVMQDYVCVLLQENPWQHVLMMVVCVDQTCHPRLNACNSSSLPVLPLYLQLSDLFFWFTLAVCNCMHTVNACLCVCVICMHTHGCKHN